MFGKNGKTESKELRAKSEEICTLCSKLCGCGV